MVYPSGSSPRPTVAAITRTNPTAGVSLVGSILSPLHAANESESSRMRRERTRPPGGKTGAGAVEIRLGGAVRQNYGAESAASRSVESRESKRARAVTGAEQTLLLP